MKKVIFFVAVVSFLASCKNLVPYTDTMKEQHGWSTEQIKHIQFYLSQDLVLRRELINGNSQIVNGKIKLVDGKRVDEILIRKGTPGVLTEMPESVRIMDSIRRESEPIKPKVVKVSSENKLLVSFEVGDDHYLSFGVNPAKSDRYHLLASEWNKGTGMGRLHYAGDEYYTGPDSHSAFIMVDLRKVDRSSLNQHVAKGRKVN